MQLNPYVRCECGKVHIVTHVRLMSVCTCGRRLHPKVGK